LKGKQWFPAINFRGKFSDGSSLSSSGDDGTSLGTASSLPSVCFPFFVHVLILVEPHWGVHHRHHLFHRCHHRRPNSIPGLSVTYRAAPSSASPSACTSPLYILAVDIDSTNSWISARTIIDPLIINMIRV